METTEVKRRKAVRKDHLFKVRVSQTQLAVIEMLAARRNVTPAELVRQLVIEEVRR